LVAGLAAAQPAAARSAFADWAAVFVAGDYHAHMGGQTEAFDNARRDLAAAFVKAGFAAGNVRQLSVRPLDYAEEKPARADVGALRDRLDEVARRAKGGCLVYMTSHGSPDGFVLGRRLLNPRDLAGLVNQACGQRPTVVIISACFSGVFVPALSAPNRMVMTAARPDRSSFGCAEDDRYPFFDGCVLQSLPAAHSFMDLPPKVRACIDAREKAEEMAPPSEPQTRVGGALAPLLPLYPFERSS
jgi:hypothetical protein